MSMLLGKMRLQILVIRPLTLIQFQFIIRVSHYVMRILACKSWNRTAYIELDDEDLDASPSHIPSQSLYPPRDLLDVAHR